MRMELVEAVIEAIEAATKAAEDRVSKRLDELERKVRACELARQLEPRVEALEAGQKNGGALAYRGVWSPADTYPAGTCVSFKGSMWIALESSAGIMPGGATEASRCWQLAVARGRDGKDAR